MSSYSFSDDAIQDLDEICEYIARNNPSSASKLFDRIRERCNYYIGSGESEIGKKTLRLPIPFFNKLS